MLSTEQIDQMIDLRERNNLPLAEIGRKFSITAERVRQVLNAHGISTARVLKPKVEPEPREPLYDWDEAVRLHTEEQLSSYEIGVKLDMNPTYVRQGLKSRGVLRSQREAIRLKQEQRYRPLSRC